MSNKYDSLDRYTFGDSDAAIYLVDVLNFYHDKRMVNRVSRLLTGFNKKCNDVVESNLSNRNKRWALDMIWFEFSYVSQNYAVELEDDRPATLMANVAKGKIRKCVDLVGLP
jgi:hypothetical protein